jgi:hypothetical protein
MSWATLIKYGVPAAAIVLLVLAIDDNGYARGRDAATKLCKETTVPAAEQAVQTRCNAVLTQTKELSHELQGSLDTVNARYYSLLKARCGKPFPSPATGSTTGLDGTAGADQSAWLLSLDQRYLNDKQAAQLVGCQKLIRTIYTMNKREDLLPVDSK